MDPSVQVLNLVKEFDLSKTKVLSLTESFEKIFNHKREIGGKLKAVDNVSFQVLPGEIFGIIGKNGAGKSTLLKLICQITFPTSGEIIFDGKIASLIEIDAGFHDELSGIENIFLKGSILGMSRNEIKEKLNDIKSFSELGEHLDMKMKFFSSGMRVRLGFSIIACLEADILVVDEVLAVGDNSFKDKCILKIQELSKSGKTILFVSHDLPLVSKLCNRGILLEAGRIKAEGEINSLIAKYLNNSIIDKKKYSSGPIEKAEVQFNKALKLKVKIRNDYNYPIPNLGFIIYNEQGFPITGNNLIESGRENVAGKKFSSMSYSLKNPNLEPGKYFISLWYGYGVKDVFNDYYALSFEIEGQRKSWAVKSEIDVEFE